MLRKESGCKVGETVSLNYSTKEKEMGDIFLKYSKEIKSTVLVKDINQVENLEGKSEIKVGESVIYVEILK